MTAFHPTFRVCVGALLIYGIAFGISACSTSNAADTNAGVHTSPYQHRIDSLLALMTIDEKVGQLVQYSSFDGLTGPGKKEGHVQEKYDRIRSGGVGSLLNVTNTRAAMEAQRLAVEDSRLGIPLLFGYDVIHGFQTMFPVPLGETASWDSEAIEQSARVAATEAAAAGIHWTFAPMVDISRDARWGRVMEGAGEDPFLGSLVAAARVRGFQGEDLTDPSTIAACTKHFAGYGFAEAGMDYNTVDVSNHTLWNVILPPFKASVDAGALTAMCAFNEIGGVPATGSPHLIRNILKEQWGFEGLIVSDWGSIAEMMQHGFASDREHACLIAAQAGVDMDMEGYCYDAHLADLVNRGEIDEAVLDDAVRRVLRVKFSLGIMDDPYRYIDSVRESTSIYTEAHKATARDVARKSIVLLKNEKDLLPLNKQGGSIAVIGPLAKDQDTPLGNWRAQAISHSAVSLYEGIVNTIGDQRKILFAEGCKLSIGQRTFAHELEFNETDRSGFAEATAVARQAEVVILVLGEDSQQSGEGRSQADVGLAGVQQELLEAIYKINKNIVVVLMNGRPIAVPWMADNIPGILEAWHLGSEAGNAIADVLFGDYNPSGKLPVTFPRSEGQLPIYYARKNTGRPGPLENEVFWAHYTDESNEPLFPFGYGLSYTTFSYGEILLNQETMHFNDTLSVSFTITNTGKRAGREVVQLYIRDLVASVTRPVKELKGFQIVALAPGESREVAFSLSKDDLSFYSETGARICEAGEFHVMAGPNSADLQMASFNLRERRAGENQ